VEGVLKVCGVCPIFVFIFPNQTGTATSSPIESDTVPVTLGLW
jgi:hypothetical protein